MSQKVEQALERLIHVLPLKENQAKLGPEIKRFHQDILSAFVETGQIMSKTQLMEKIKAGEPQGNGLKSILPTAKFLPWKKQLILVPDFLFL